MNAAPLPPVACIAIANALMVLFNLVGMTAGCKPPPLSLHLCIWALLIAASLTGAGYRL
jgi:hypothetical protein